MYKEKVPGQKISVIIPCLNEINYIKETINSVLIQKDNDKIIEIIVVDGYSDDGTREMLEELQDKDSRIIVINNSKRITPVALNLGVKRASGDYIFVLGAHAKIANDYVMNCVKIFETHPDVSCAGGPITSIGKTLLSKAIAEAMSSSIGVGNAKHRFPDYSGYAEMACFPIFKSTVFNEIGFFDESLVRNQDDDFCFRLRLQGGKVYISSEARSFYYVRDSLRMLFKQYYQYGYWRIVLITKHKIPIAFRQQVPFLFFSILSILIILGILLDSLIIAVVVPFLYFFILNIYSAKVFIFGKKSFSFLLPLVIFTLHCSYAIGFGVGLIRNHVKKVINFRIYDIRD